LKTFQLLYSQLIKLEIDLAFSENKSVDL